MNTINSLFELGDSAVVMGYAQDYESEKREPKLEGTVSARGRTCVRLRFTRRNIFGKVKIKERWFTVKHHDYHVEKINQY